MKHTQILLSVLAATASFVNAGGLSVNAKQSLTLDGARHVINAVVAEAKKHNATGAVAVVDDGGNVIALERIDGTFAAGSQISIGKARTAALFKHPTSFFEDVIAKGRTSMVALNDFTPLRGGEPIMMGDQIIGAVGVSGASSAQQDEEFAKVGAAALSAVQGSPSSTLTEPKFFDSGSVSAAFAKGMPLLETGSYKIHASRRDGNGLAEIHERDTDIVHVLNGTATLITGGVATDTKTIATEEIRGQSIRNGETRQLKAGDVVIIPNGVPHQFLDVTEPFTYYVVKVRSTEGGI